MNEPTPGVFRQLLPVLFLVACAMFYVAWVERSDAYVARNLIPMLLLILLAVVTLQRGHGRWTGAGWRWPLATIGFAVPALGLSLYLHYGYTVDLNSMVSDSIYPREVFRFLPVYTVMAGAIGFAIGWLAGNNV